jgi:hypothetical protein
MPLATGNGGQERGLCQGRDGSPQSTGGAMVAVPAAERARCVRLTTSSKMPSYVVITCIEMARSARQPSEEQANQRKGEDEIKKPLSGYSSQTSNGQYYRQQTDVLHHLARVCKRRRHRVCGGVVPRRTRHFSGGNAVG